MNLKFWQKQAAATGYRRHYVAEDAQSRARKELVRDMVLAGMQENHPVWQAVLELVDEHAERELAGALAPNLTNEQRQFASGAAATADYLCQYLRDARSLAAAKVKKQKGEE